jgi:soluble lytic murein transglycosylase
MRKIIKILIIFIILAFLINSVISIAYPIKYKDVVYEYSKEYGQDPFLVFSIIKTESNFNQNAISSKNARGLMQISEITARWAVDELNIENFELDDLYDIDLNIKIGTWYISKLINQFGNLEVALAAYNAGSGNVTNWLNDNQYSYDSKSLYKIPFKETENYVNKVLNSFKIYTFLYDEQIFFEENSIFETMTNKIHSFILELRKEND